MIEPQALTVTVESQRAFSRAVRFALAVVVLGLSYANIYLACRVGTFKQIYTEMLGNKPLPGGTGFLIHYQPLFVALSALFPVVAVAAVFIPSVTRSIYLAGAMLLCVFVQLFYQWHMLAAPLSSIIEGMQGIPQ